MTDTELNNGQLTGQAYAEQMLRNDVAAISNLLNNLHNIILFQGLNPNRPMPRAILEDAADRLERLAVMVRGQMGE